MNDQKLKKLRALLLFNQFEMAEKLGVSMDYYVKMENGEIDISIVQANDIKEIFGELIFNESCK